MTNGECPILRGKGFGGSTLIHGCRIIRGNKNDFDNWGLEGWNYQHCLPYFKKYENTSLGDEDIGFHGYKGPMPVQYYKPYHNHHFIAIQANKELGVRTVDYNGKSQLGISAAQYHQDNGRRADTGKIFLSPINGQSNVELLGDSYVLRILIGSRQRGAYGVLFSRNKKIYRVRARKEVILSGGVINTPQLLMLSGIGPANHLRNLGIQPVVDLAVGDNLIDHPIFQGMHFNTSLIEMPKTVQQYVSEFLQGSGLFTIEIGTQTLGFYQTKYASADGSPDLELFYTFPNPSVNIPQRSSGYKQATLDALGRGADTRRNMQLAVVVLDVKSRGNVRLRSKDPFEYPLINLNMLSDKEDHDRNVIRSGIRFIMKLLNTKAFRMMNARMRVIDLPACRRYKYLSRGYWDCAIKEITTPGNHLMGTCKMGNSPKEGAVVDNLLRVFGVKNLRVVDSSVMPSLSGHTVGATMMLAEKASDFIKVQHGVPVEELNLDALTLPVFRFLKNLSQ